MQLDDVVASLTTGPRVGEAMQRSVRWLDRCIEFHQESGRDQSQNLFAIIQGGLDSELRKQCLEQMVQRKNKVAGFAIGGLSGGEAKGGNTCKTHKFLPCTHLTGLKISSGKCRWDHESCGVQTNAHVASSNVPTASPSIVTDFLPQSQPAYSRSAYFRSQICDGYRFRRGWVINQTAPD
jgi:hypothetical protein